MAKLSVLKPGDIIAGTDMNIIGASACPYLVAISNTFYSNYQAPYLIGNKNSAVT